MIQKNFQPPTEEEIARYAYFLWESEGKIPGHDLDYWLQAEAHLTAAREHEAGLLDTAPATPKRAEKSETVAVSAMPQVKPKSQRKRVNRSVREPEPALAA